MRMNMLLETKLFGIESQQERLQLQNYIYLFSTIVPINTGVWIYTFLLYIRYDDEIAPTFTLKNASCLGAILRGRRHVHYCQHYILPLITHILSFFVAWLITRIPAIETL